MRQHSEAVYLKVKALFRHVVDLTGGLKLAAEATRGQIPTLSRYSSQSPENMVNFPPIDVILDLEKKLGEPVISKEMVRICLENRELLPATPEDICKQGQILAVELGDFNRSILEAEEDGIWTNNELISAEKELQDIIDAAQKAKRQIADIRTARKAG